MFFDLHCDTVWKIHEQKKKGNILELPASDALQLDEEKMVKSDYFAQCFALWVHARHGNPYEVYQKLLATYREELVKCTRLAPAYTYADLLKNREDGKISAVLTMEDSAPVGSSLERLQELYRDGVRMICLLWNYPNTAGFPNFGRYFDNGDPDRLTPDTVNGLTDFGRELVREMNRLGMIVDVSHLSDAGFYDVISISDKPIVASHSNVRALCAVSRNMTDDMLYKLAENGGVTGMNYAAGFLDRANGRETVPLLLKHIQYVKEKIGIEHIALGSDFDGIDPNIELQNAGMMSALVDALSTAGFSDDEIEKITYKNALRVFKDNLR